MRTFPGPISPQTVEALSGSFPLLIDGEFVPSASGRTGATTDPATGEVPAEFALADGEDVDRAVLAARRAFDGPWSRFSHFDRARVLAQDGRSARRQRHPAGRAGDAGQ